MAFLCIIGIIASASIESIFNFSPSHLSSTDRAELYFYEYTKPQAHIGPYSLGVACGFIIFAYRKSQNHQLIYDKIAFNIAKFQENIYGRWATFITGLILINVIFIATYDIYNHPGPNNTYHH